MIKKKIYLFIKSIKSCVSLAMQSSKFYTVARFVCSLCSPVIAILTALLGKLIIDLLAGQSVSATPQKDLMILFIIMVGIVIFRLFIQRLEQYCHIVHDEVISSKTSLILMERGLTVDMACYDDTDYYNKITSASRDASCLPMVLWNIIACISAFISFLMSFYLLSRESLVYSAVLLIAGIPSAIAATKYTKSLYNLSLSQIEGERKMSYISYIASAKTYAQSIRIYNAGKYLKKKYTMIWDELFCNRRKSLFARAITTGLLGCLPEIALVFISCDIAFRILARTATIGDYSLYTGLSLQLWSGIYLFYSSITQIYDNQLKINNFQSLMEIERSVCDAGVLKLEPVCTISFENVYFTYPTAKSPTLCGVDFYINKGEHIVLVGLNGSGKSTIIKLLMRFYDVDCGVIKLNGVDIKKYTIESVRKQFSVYFQEESNYSFTLRENIMIADIEADETSSIERAMNGSDTKDILKKAPLGLDTYLYKMFSNDGIELSGGQHQKIALARAFYRRHSALILDEPSASLDPKAEHELFEHLAQFTSGKTTIFTSHRLSNVYLANRIFVIEGGRLIEEGTHDDLLYKNGRYAELFYYQRKKLLLHEQ